MNVVETWNGTNNFIFFGKGGDIATNRLDDQEVAALTLHLLQICLVYMNTLLIQDVLAEPAWGGRMQPDDSARSARCSSAISIPMARFAGI